MLLDKGDLMKRGLNRAFAVFTRPPMQGTGEP